MEVIMSRPNFPVPAVFDFRRVTLAICSVLLLGGCTIPPVSDPASRYYDIPTGSSIKVRQDIEIPLGWARAHLQGGRVVAMAALRRYEPYCEIEVNDVSATPRQVVRAGSFTVMRVWRDQELGAAASGVKLAAHLADSGIGNRVDFGVGIRLGEADRDGGASQLVLNVVRLSLNSPEQTQVRELRCTAGWADRVLAVYPTVAEMRGALGELAEIEIP
jgi:hypothetical protein